MILLANIGMGQGKIGEGGHPASWVSTSHHSLFAPSVLNGNLALRGQRLPPF